MAGSEMGVQKTVFLSYRRKDRLVALLVHKDLEHHGFDVFIDYTGIGPGDFERSIVDNIKSRAHFVLVLTPGALDRCANAGDWLRREIEEAMDAKRNLIPLLFNGFQFPQPFGDRSLVDVLSRLSRYQAIPVHDPHFDADMRDLRERFLSRAIESVMHPPTQRALQVASEQRKAAEAAYSPPSPSEKPAAETSQRRKPSTRPSTVSERFAAVAAAAPPTDISLPTMDFDGSIVSPAARNARPSRVRENKASGLLLFATGFLLIAMALAYIWWSYASRADAGPINREDQFALGRKHLLGMDGLSQSDVEAVKWLQKAALQGHARGQSALALMHAEGKGGLKQDQVEATKWFQKAALNGDAGAQVVLGSFHAIGANGVAKDEVEALKWFQKSALQHHPKGQAFLGRMYEDGRAGLTKDYGEAVKWYLKSALQEDSTGQVSLGRMYERGRGGLRKDDGEASKWYLKAAIQDDPDGQVQMGRLYEAGRVGLTKDDVEAVRWYQKAASQRFSDGEYQLGRMHEEGRGGLEKDQSRATALYRLAAAHGRTETAPSGGRAP
jgi:TPR repeat protein